MSADGHLQPFLIQNLYTFKVKKYNNCVLTKLATPIFNILPFLSKDRLRHPAIIPNSMIN